MIVRATRDDVLLFDVPDDARSILPAALPNGTPLPSGGGTTEAGSALRVSPARHSVPWETTTLEASTSRLIKHVLVRLDAVLMVLPTATARPDIVTRPAPASVPAHERTHILLDPNGSFETHVPFIP